MGALVGCLGALLTVVSAAGPALKTPNGFRVGPGRLHPSFATELDYDSAAGLFPVSGSTLYYRMSPALVAHFRPGLELKIRGGQFRLKAKGSVDFVDYTGLLTEGAKGSSHVELATNVMAEWHADHPVSAVLTNDLTRSDRSHDAALGVGVISLYEQARVSVPWKVRDALTLTPHLSGGFEDFEPLSTVPVPGCSDPVCSPSALAAADSRTFAGGLDAEWRWLPRISVLAQTKLTTRGYAGGNNPDALILHAQVGLIGRLTPRLAVVAVLGWAQDFDGSGLSTWVGHVEADYAATQTAHVKVGYARIAEPVSQYGAYLDNRPFLEGKVLLGDRLLMHGKISFDRVTFFAGSGRIDHAASLEIGPDYPLRRWLVLGLVYRLTVRSSTLPEESVNFDRHELLTRITVTY